MKATKYLAVVLGGLLLFAACKKELSFENNLPQGNASGTLKSLSGDCQPMTVKGNYVRDSILTDSNYIIVQINFSLPGKYKVTTDTTNGFYFQDSGYALVTGLQDIKLKGSGKPILVQQTNFLVSFDTSACTFLVNVTDTEPPPIVPPTTSGDYFPTSDSSNWTYQTDLSTPDSTHTIVSNTDSTIEGNTYRTFIAGQSGSFDTSYFRKANGLYYAYGYLYPNSLDDTLYRETEYIFLKDNLPVSSTWESPEVDGIRKAITGKSKIVFTIEGKDIQTSIGNTTFDSVIQVKREYMFAPSTTGVYETISTGNFYYAKNIGFIKAEISNPLPATLYISRWQIYYQ